MAFALGIVDDVLNTSLTFIPHKKVQSSPMPRALCSLSALQTQRKPMWCALVSIPGYWRDIHIFHTFFNAAVHIYLKQNDENNKLLKK